VRSALERYTTGVPPADFVAQLNAAASASTVRRVKLVRDSFSLGTVARRLTLNRYLARLKPRSGSLALSVRRYVLTVSQVGCYGVAGGEKRARIEEAPAGRGSW